ncbi:MAG: ring-cleaving dioxygenase [Hyphomicrobiales bacterium]
MSSVHGIHHVTAICGDAQENLDFYTGVLGLRLVKRSVNQDSPDTYHLFYADAAGSPGADLTFFPWPGMPGGTPGAGLAMEVGFALPEGALGYWSDRLKGLGIEATRETRFGDETLSFRDPHGLGLSLTESSRRLPVTPWEKSPVPAERQIQGFHAVRLWERGLGISAGFLRDAMGFAEDATDGAWHRLAVDGGGSSRWIEIKETPDLARGIWGVGYVHHVAFRVRDDEEQGEVRRKVLGEGRPATEVIDRFWFRSVYFHEPGGVLYELATDGPGFSVDEKPGELGERLILPPWLEPHRGAIERGLPPLKSTTGAR